MMMSGVRQRINFVHDQLYRWIKPVPPNLKAKFITTRGGSRATYKSSSTSSSFNTLHNRHLSLLRHSPALNYNALLLYGSIRHFTTPITTSSVMTARHYTNIPKSVFTYPFRWFVASMTSALAYATYKVQEGVSRASNFFKDTKDSFLDYYSDAQIWLTNMLASGTDEQKSQHRHHQYDKESNDNTGRRNGSDPLIPVIASSTSFQNSSDDDMLPQSNISAEELTSDSDANLMLLTKKLIEIRSLLKNVSQSDDALQIPSIVVIGSQSSGKSSVLESIVNENFLPKGDNMVTKRPLEITLIHSPELKANESYAEFPKLDFGRITDFNLVKSYIHELNASVSSSQCISDNPIELRIHSCHVPDLCLIDLPGYVRLSSVDQPEKLKDSIASLCDKYISGSDNIILAVSAANVDLANSEALRAAKRVDPKGLRTIGVVTKMDLVTPESGKKFLENTNYPLRLGYIGVICAPTAQKTGGVRRFLMGATSKEERNSTELQYFREHRQDFQHVSVGTDVLRKHLVKTLESFMSKSLDSIQTKVQKELEEVRYLFKVNYNDRDVSVESYFSESMDILKQKFKDLMVDYSRPSVRERVNELLDKVTWDILQRVYYDNSHSSNRHRMELSNGSASDNEDDSPSFEYNIKDLERRDGWTDEAWQHWCAKLDWAASELTKCGVGRRATQLVADDLLTQMEQLIQNEPFIWHTNFRQKVLNIADNILRENFNHCMEQVENTVKPYKYEIEFSKSQWEDGLKRTQHVLQSKIGDMEKRKAAIEKQLGRRLLRNIKAFLEEEEEHTREVQLTNKPDNSVHADKENKPPTESASSTSVPNKETQPSRALQQRAFHPQSVELTKQFMKMESQAEILKYRLSLVQPSRYSFCRSKDLPGCQPLCPEVYLFTLSQGITSSAIMFLWIELLVQFSTQWPREIDRQIRSQYSQSDKQKFSVENPAIKGHLNTLYRLNGLEFANERLKQISLLEKERFRLEQK